MVAFHLSPSDEGRHLAGTDALWGESWYHDFAAADGSLGTTLFPDYIAAANALGTRPMLPSMELVNAALKPFAAGTRAVG